MKLTKTYKALLILVMVLVGFIVTNPSQVDMKAYIGYSDYSQMIVRRDRNYLVCSIYEVHYVPLKHSEQYLGLLGNFFELK